MKTKRNYDAILTVYGLDAMKKDKLKRVKGWLSKIIKKIGEEQYAGIARFRLMK